MSYRADLLVVDDEPVLINAVRRTCEAEGLVVDAVSSADAGQDRLSGDRYRLVMLDLLLPGVGGLHLLDAAQRLRPETPVVVISGSVTRDRTAECFQHGAFDVLPKPFDVDELLAVVSRALGYSELASSEPRDVKQTGFGAGAESEKGSADLYSLGRHAWVSIEQNGSVSIGIAENFRPVSEIRRVDLPIVEAQVLQGNVCASITTGDDLVHRVRSPLSVRILERNQSWEEGKVPAQDISEQWLVRALPTDLENATTSPAGLTIGDTKAPPRSGGHMQSRRLPKGVGHRSDPNHWVGVDRRDEHRVLHFPSRRARSGRGGDQGDPGRAEQSGQALPGPATHSRHCTSSRWPSREPGKRRARRAR